MNERERCPNGCGETLVRHNETIKLHYGQAYSWRRDQAHGAWYGCSACGRTYVSSVLKRFKEHNIV